MFPQPIKAMIEMRAPMGDEVRQEIPIINNFDKDASVKVLLEGDSSFSGFRNILKTQGLAAEKTADGVLPAGVQA